MTTAKAISLQARRPGAPTDGALVLSARSGDRVARDLLFTRHAQKAFGLALRIVGSDAEVDDIVQDAFVEALSHLEQLNEPAAFRSWLNGIVARVAYKRLRKRRLLARLGLRRNEPIDFDALPLGTAPADVVVELRRIFSVLHRLPASERVALVLYRVEGMKLLEVAQHMNLSLTTVKRRIAKAEALLARYGDAGEPLAGDVR